MRRCKVKFLPAGTELYVTAGTTIRDTINLARFDFDFTCGGRGKCGKCRVLISGGVGAPTAEDRKHLDQAEMARGFRLACATMVNEEMTVELPYLKTPHHQILIAGVDKQVKIDPHLRKVRLEPDPPKLEDQRPDWERLQPGLAEAFLAAEPELPLGVLRDLPQTLRQANWRVTAVTDGEAVLGLEPGDGTGTMLGIAFDIGTTTLVGYLMDLVTGQERGVVSALNPQTSYGADVITRISFASRQEDGLDRLHQAIIAALNQLIEEASRQAGASPAEIYAVVVAGNTTMHHLFLGVNPEHLAVAPYIPAIKRPVAYRAQELGLKVNPAGKVYVLPNIAGYVGADTVGVLLATELDWSDRIRLVIDIGTNGEIVLGSRERLVACSTAAGPAFEGAHISSGMRGTAGAIDHVRFGDNLMISVIGGAKPQGICGSGLLDAVAGLLEQGIADRTGRLLHADRLPPGVARYRSNMVLPENGIRAFTLVDGQHTADGFPILITQNDIRELQLAKGAIATGIQALVEHLGIDQSEIAEVLLAGAFGSYLNPHSACAIGLIPPVLESRVKPVGNAAGSGAKAALLSRSEWRRAEMIADFVEYLELSAYPDFTRLFAANLNFPSR